MGTIAIEGMEFHAFHGCFAEERQIGNKFLVDLYFDTSTASAEISDDLAETVNYAEVYDVVKAEMSIRSNLLEHVARRILDAIHFRFPEIEVAEVKISKMNPPVGGVVKNVSVVIAREE